MGRHSWVKLSFVNLLIFLVFVPQAFAAVIITDEGKVVNTQPGMVLGQSTHVNQGNQAQKPVRVEVKTKTKDLGKASATLRIKVKEDFLELETDKTSTTGSELELNTPVSTSSGSLEIDDRGQKNKTKIRAQNNAAYVIRNKLAAQSHFPLMVNLETNELIVTTPKGSKVVTVLPDAAVQHMLAANVLDQLGGKGGLRWLEYQEKLKNATQSGELDGPDASAAANLDEDEDESNNASNSATPQPTPTPVVVDEVDEVITLTTNEEGTVVYQIEGTKNKKLLGLRPIELQRTVIVSAETGELLKIIEDLRTRLLDLLST